MGSWNENWIKMKWWLLGTGRVIAGIFVRGARRIAVETQSGAAAAAEHHLHQSSDLLFESVDPHVEHFFRVGLQHVRPDRQTKTNILTPDEITDDVIHQHRQANFDSFIPIRIGLIGNNMTDRAIYRRATTSHHHFLLRCPSCEYWSQALATGSWNGKHAIKRWVNERAYLVGEITSKQ